MLAMLYASFCLLVSLKVILICPFIYIDINPTSHTHIYIFCPLKTLILCSKYAVGFYLKKHLGAVRYCIVNRFGSARLVKDNKYRK